MHRRKGTCLDEIISTAAQMSAEGTPLAEAPPTARKLEMRPYLLSPDAYPAFWENAAVVLHRGKYKGFGPAEVWALAQGVEGWPGAQSSIDRLSKRQADYLQSLLADGVLTTDLRRGKPARPVDIAYPTRTLLDHELDERPAIRLGHRLRFCEAVLGTRLWQVGRKIESHATWVRAVRNAGVAPSESARTLVHVFRHLRPLLLAGRDRCVLDSLALLKFLALCGAEVKHISWVVGVRIRGPAHCWLQSGDLVVSDVPERVRAFKPIFVVQATRENP
jgi:Transglutaminase-like superfamily